MFHCKMRPFWFIIILGVFTYYGGENVPNILKDNKELILAAFAAVLMSYAASTSIPATPEATIATTVVATQEHWAWKNSRNISRRPVVFNESNEGSKTRISKNLMLFHTYLRFLINQISYQIKAHNRNKCIRMNVIFLNKQIQQRDTD